MGLTTFAFHFYWPSYLILALHSSTKDPQLSGLAYWRYRATSSWHWYRKTKTVYDVHSPLLADFIDQVIMDDREYHTFGLVQQIRKWWQKNTSDVSIRTLGAASKVTKAKVRPVAKLVKQAAIPPQVGALLFRAALWNRAERIVELGTNMGISTLYLHGANRQAALHTIEGNSDIAGLARKTFELARCSSQLHQYIGPFDELLGPIIEPLNSLDLLFVDGDHRYQATLDYVNMCLPLAQENSLFIIADIHWSPGMEAAWEQLIALPQVTASIDLYHLGILFFKPGLTPQQHLNLIPYWAKPWRFGFFSS